MKKKQPLNKETLISILFTVTVVVAMAVIFLLSGRRKQTSEALDASGATTAPSVTTATTASSASESTASSPTATAKASTSTAVPTATPIPFGIDEEGLLSALELQGLYVTGSEVTDLGKTYTICAEPDPVFYNIGSLALNVKNEKINGFLLYYPVMDDTVDSDGSAISAALELEDSTAMLKGRDEAAETVFYGLLSVFDSSGMLPLTVRNEWCAQFLSFLNDTKHKSTEDTWGKFHLSLYAYGSGQDMKLYCTVQYNG